jgi:hypothetical protein
VPPRSHADNQLGNLHLLQNEVEPAEAMNRTALSFSEPSGATVEPTTGQTRRRRGRARQLNPDFAVVFLSGYEPGLMEPATARQVLQKPFTPPRARTRGGRGAGGGAEAGGEGVRQSPYSGS